MQRNQTQIDGVVKSAAYRILGFGDQLLNSSVSLLEKLRELGAGWLCIIQRIVYNSGGADATRHAEAVYAAAASINVGFGKRQMKVYNEARRSSSRRFCKPHRMMLVQADIKYGPVLPIGKNGKGVQTYLSAAIDDHSRLILESGFYASQEQKIVEDTFRRAILKHAKMDAVCFDNESQYISKQLKMALSRLEIRILHCKPYSPASKGKIPEGIGAAVCQAEGTADQCHLLWCLPKGRWRQCMKPSTT